MNLSLIKLIAMMSGFIGIILGFLTAVPYIGGFAFLVLICFSAIIELTILMKLGLLELESVQESSVIGAIIGFISFIAFSIIYMPLVIILLKVFKYHTNYGVSLALTNSNFWIILLISLFLAIFSATINAFTGFLTFYIRELIKDIKNK